jgi:hypothetical protein
MGPILEKSHIMDNPDDKRRPADILLPHFRLAQDYALDVAVTSPTQPAVCSAAAKEAGAALSR